VGCLFAVASVSLALGRFGHATIVAVQRFVAWTFGLLTLAICPLLIRHAHWSSLLSRHPGSYLALLSALSVVVASGGISWVNLSADYTRYLPRDGSARKIVLWTSFGATVPLGVLVVVGVMLASTIPGLAGAANPVAAIGSVLPSWMEVPYLLAALVGLVSQMVMALYSSGLGLLVLGVRVRRSRTVLIDAAVVVLAGSFFTVVRQGFLGPFVSFVELLACPIATWAAVLVMDMALRRRRYVQGYADSGSSPGPRFSAVLAWAFGSVLGLCCTASPLFTGPIARGIFARSSLGYFVGFIASGAIYLVAETLGAWLTRRAAVRLQGQVQATG
jgi:purine-cytosine permease-like protein